MSAAGAAGAAAFVLGSAAACKVAVAAAGLAWRALEVVERRLRPRKGWWSLLEIELDPATQLAIFSDDD
jgi:hypothetical protein